MKKLNKRALQAQETKKLIFDHAIRLIREKGFYNVLIEEIASAAGVSIGTFYYYFKNKDDLALLVADNMDQHYVNYYENEMKKPKQKNALEILEGILNVSLETYSKIGAELGIIIYSSIMRDPEVNERWNGMFRVYRQIVSNLIRAGQEQKLIRADMDVESIVQNFYKATRGGIMDWCINGTNMSPKEYTRDFFRCFIDGLKPQKTL